MSSASRGRSGARRGAGSTGACNISAGTRAARRRSGPSSCMFRDLRRRLDDAAEAALPARELSEGGRGGGGIGRRPPAAEAALPARQLSEGVRESCGIEIRPQAVNEVQLRIGALPQQKVAQAALAAAADEQIDLRCRGLRMLSLSQEAQVLRGILERDVAQAAPGLDEHLATRVVDGEAQVQPRALRSQAFAALDLPEQRLAQAVAPANHVQADGLGEAAVGLRQQVASQQPE